MGVLGLHPSWYINVNLVICHSPPIMRQPFCLFASMLKIPLSLFVLCCTLLAGCGANGPALKPFKMDIQQGNVVTSKMLLQLKPGMTKSQVRFIMGTPLIVDSFHKDRWDYFYQMRQAGKIVEQRRVILDFDKELLTKVRGDVVPQGTVSAAKDADVSELNTVNAPITVEPKPKQASVKNVNVWDRLKFWKKDEKLLAKSEVTPARVNRTAAASAQTSTVAAPMVLAVAEESSLKAAKLEAANINLKNIEVEKNLPENLPVKTVPAKNMLENNELDKSGSKISWLESLKFWKKNKPTEAETAALDEAKAETAASAAKSVAQDSASVSQATAPEAQSILVVPIELPNAEIAKDGVNTHAIVAEEPVTAKPLQTEQLNTKKAPAITGKESMKTFKSPSQKMMPAKPEFIKPMPAKPAVPSSVFKKPLLQKPAPVDSQLSRPLKPLSLEPKKGEQLIFRMDKTLNLARNLVANPQVTPELANMVPDATTLNANTLDVNKLDVNKLDTATLNATTLDTALLPVKTAETQPVEAEPSFFDKMLEKIGF